jgi:Flp pilus assembly secretin CpaC
MYAWTGFKASLRAAAQSLFVLCGAMSAACAADAGDTVIVVKVDEARPIKVPPSSQTLIIGNPMIADVTLLKQGSIMVLTGKGFGETNFIALDASGNQVAEFTVRVVLGENALVVQRGLDRQSYTCAPRCQPTARLGDDPKYFTEVTGQVTARNAAANTK